MALRGAAILGLAGGIVAVISSDLLIERPSAEPVASVTGGPADRAPPALTEASAAERLQALAAYQPTEAIPPRAVAVARLQQADFSPGADADAALVRTGTAAERRAGAASGSEIPSRSVRTIAISATGAPVSDSVAVHAAPDAAISEVVPDALIAEEPTSSAEIVTAAIPQADSELTAEGAEAETPSDMIATEEVRLPRPRPANAPTEIKAAETRPSGSRDLGPPPDCGNLWAYWRYTDRSKGLREWYCRKKG